MNPTFKNIKSIVFLGSVGVAIIGFVISTTRDTVEASQTLERVSKTQEALLEVNAEQHDIFNNRITDVEAWILRKEGYDAAMAERREHSND